MIKTEYIFFKKELNKFFLETAGWILQMFRVIFSSGCTLSTAHNSRHRIVRHNITPIPSNGKIPDARLGFEKNKPFDFQNNTQRTVLMPLPITYNADRSRKETVSGEIADRIRKIFNDLSVNLEGSLYRRTGQVLHHLPALRYIRKRYCKISYVV